MGSSFGQTASGSWAMDCWNCSKVGGVRRRKCPAGYCPASQLCQPCLTELRRTGKWAEMHKDCQSASDAYKARLAAEDADPEHYPRAAWGRHHTGSALVLVLTKAETWVLIHEDHYVAGYLPDEHTQPWAPDLGIELPPGHTKRIA